MRLSHLGKYISIELYVRVYGAIDLIRLDDLELGTGEGVKQIVKVCFIADNG